MPASAELYVCHRNLRLCWRSVRELPFPVCSYTNRIVTDNGCLMNEGNQGKKQSVVIWVTGYRGKPCQPFGSLPGHLRKHAGHRILSEIYDNVLYPESRKAESCVIKNDSGSAFFLHVVICGRGRECLLNGAQECFDPKWLPDEFDAVC